MDTCEPLKEYAWLVDAVRRHQDERASLDEAVDTALVEMPDEYEIKAFLLKNRAEVKNMFLTEYNEEKVMMQERAEGREEGRLEGRQEGALEERQRVAVDMLKEDSMNISFIAKISRLSEDKVLDLARENGISVV